MRRNPPYKWRAFLKVLRKFRQDGRLLDVGCALGLFLQQARKYFECDGCDLSQYALEQAREQLPENISLFQGSLGSIPGKSNYDVVTCFDVIEHIPDTQPVWKNLHELLKPGGLLVITVPVYDGPLGWLTNRLDHDPTHVHRRERSFWIEQVREHFHLLSVVGVWRYFFLNRFYINLISRSSWKVTTAVMIVAKR